MKFYGTMICPDCRTARELLPAVGVEFEYVDITVSTANMREFLRLRDGNKAFDGVRKAGRIGIPCFLLDDGRVFLDTDSLLKEVRK